MAANGPPPASASAIRGVRLLMGGQCRCGPAPGLLRRNKARGAAAPPCGCAKPRSSRRPWRTCGPAASWPGPGGAARRGRGLAARLAAQPGDGAIEFVDARDQRLDVLGRRHAQLVQRFRNAVLEDGLELVPLAGCLGRESVAMLAMRLVASESFSSATAWVLRWIDTPSFTSASNTLPPSSCALEKAPRPASQICCADSLTVPASWALFFVSASAPAAVLPVFGFSASSSPWWTPGVGGTGPRRGGRGGDFTAAPPAKARWCLLKGPPCRGSATGVCAEWPRGEAECENDPQTPGGSPHALLRHRRHRLHRQAAGPQAAGAQGRGGPLPDPP
jgi:hypothetical protein